MLRTGVLQDSVVARILLPCAVSNRVVRDLSLASSGESLRGGWFSQPSRGANSIFSRRAALVAHAHTSGSRDLSSASSIQLFISYHPHLDCDSRSLPSSLTWFVHSILHFLPYITAAASIRPAINQSITQSIAPPRCVTPPPSNVLPRSKAPGTVQSYISGQVSFRHSRRQSGSSATPRGQVVSIIPTTHLRTNATTTLEA